MTKNDRNLVLPILTLVFAFVGFLIVYKFLMPGISENRAKSAAFDADITLAQVKIDSISVANKKIGNLSDLVSSLLIAVPDTIDSPNLIAEVETIASQNQVGLSSVSPPTETISGSQSVKTGGQKNLSVTVAVSGSFANLENFISGIESSIRFSRITGITMTSASNGQIAASISFQVYKRPSN